MHTEELFAALPFLSATSRRMSSALPSDDHGAWDFSDFKKGKARYSLREDILFDALVQYPQQLFEIFMSRAKCKKLLQETLKWKGSFSFYREKRQARFRCSLRSLRLVARSLFSL